MNTAARIGFSALCCLIALSAAADTAYVTSQLKVGLHQDKTADSPIVKVIPVGTALDVLKHGAGMSQVRDPSGTTGWLDNSYLTDKAPAGSAQVQQLQKQLADAQQQISDLQGQAGDEMAASPDQQSALRKKNADLAQKLKEEQLRAGEFQIKLAELRKRVGENNDTASLYKQIEQLREDKKKLEIELSGRAGNSGPVQMLEHAASGSGASLNVPLSALAIAFVVILLAGFAGGIYLMDYRNRRRHGGFRV